jgi:hypothetical protein
MVLGRFEARVQRSPVVLQGMGSLLEFRHGIQTRRPEGHVAQGGATTRPISCCASGSAAPNISGRFYIVSFGDGGGGVTAWTEGSGVLSLPAICCF